MTDIQFRWHMRANQLGRIANGMQGKADAIAAKAAQDIVAGAQGRAPVDTGTLKNSIQASSSGPGRWRVVVGADYGVYVNYGTRFMAARPFFTESIAQVRPQFIAAMRQVLS